MTPLPTGFSFPVNMRRARVLESGNIILEQVKVNEAVGAPTGAPAAQPPHVPTQGEAVRKSISLTVARELASERKNLSPETVAHAVETGAIEGVVKKVIGWDIPLGAFERWLSQFPDYQKGGNQDGAGSV